MPSIIFSLSNNQIAQYLKAYYEGDGGVDGHQICATTKSKDLASDLAYLLLRFGIVARYDQTSREQQTPMMRATLIIKLVFQVKTNLKSLLPKLDF